MDRIRSPRRTGFRWKTLIALGTLLQACGGGDGPSGVPATPQGEYTLNMIEQKALPYAWYTEPDYSLEVTAGSISIKADGKWVAKITSRETVAGFVSTYNDSTFGTWTSANGTASLTNAESSTISSATWTGADVTVTDVEGTTTRKILYRKN
jgi:hypothetical protein